MMHTFKKRSKAAERRRQFPLPTKQRHSRENSPNTASTTAAAVPSPDRHPYGALYTTALSPNRNNTTDNASSQSQQNQQQPASPPTSSGDPPPPFEPQQIASLFKTVASLQDALRVLMKDCEDEATESRSTIQTLRTRLDESESTIETLKERIEELETNPIVLLAELNRLESNSIQPLSLQVTGLESSMEGLRQHVTTAECQTESTLEGFRNEVQESTSHSRTHQQKSQNAITSLTKSISSFVRQQNSINLTNKKFAISMRKTVEALEKRVMALDNNNKNNNPSSSSRGVVENLAHTTPVQESNNNNNTSLQDSLQRLQHTFETKTKTLEQRLDVMDMKSPSLIQSIQKLEQCFDDRTKTLEQRLNDMDSLKLSRLSLFQHEMGSPTKPTAGAAGDGSISRDGNSTSGDPFNPILANIPWEDRSVDDNLSPVHHHHHEDTLEEDMSHLQDENINTRSEEERIEEHRRKEAAEKVRKELEEKELQDITESLRKAEEERLREVVQEEEKEVEAIEKEQLRIEEAAKAKREARLKRVQTFVNRERGIQNDTQTLQKQSEAFLLHITAESKAKAEARAQRKMDDEKQRIESKARSIARAQAMAKIREERKQKEAEAKAEAEAKQKAEQERIQKEAKAKAIAELEAEKKKQTEILEAEAEAAAAEVAKMKADDERLLREAEERAKTKADAAKNRTGSETKTVSKSSQEKAAPTEKAEIVADSRMTVPVLKKKKLPEKEVSKEEAMAKMRESTSIFEVCPKFDYKSIKEKLLKDIAAMSPSEYPETVNPFFARYIKSRKGRQEADISTRNIRIYIGRFDTRQIASLAIELFLKKLQEARADFDSKAKTKQLETSADSKATKKKKELSPTTREQPISLRKRSPPTKERMTRDNSVYANGTIIRKRFEDGKWYEGKVIGYDRTVEWYKIKYLDGAYEEFDEGDMKKYYKKIQTYSQVESSSKKRPATKDTKSPKRAKTGNPPTNDMMQEKIRNEMVDGRIPREIFDLMLNGKSYSMAEMAAALKKENTKGFANNVYKLSKVTEKDGKKYRLKDMVFPFGRPGA